MKRILTFILALTLVAGTFSACNSGKPGSSDLSGGESVSAGGNETAPTDKDEDLVFGVTLLTLQDAFYITQKQAYEEMAKQHGVKLNIMDSASDVVKQTDQVNDLIAQGVDVLILVPVEVNAAADMVKASNAAGIPVVCNSSDIDAEVATKVLRDDLALGRDCGENAAKWINENLDGKGKIAMLNFPLFSNTLAWEQGFLEKIAELSPASEVVTSIEANSRETGLQAMEDALQSHPEVNFVWAVNDPAGLGACAAIEAAGRNDVFVTFMCGGDEEAFTRLQQGTAQSLVVGIEQIYPYEDGIASFEAALKIAKGEAVPELINTPGVWWNENNVAENLAAYPAYPEGISAIN